MMTTKQIAFLENWIVNMQRKMGNGLGEGLLLQAAAVIWEG